MQAKPAEFLQLHASLPGGGTAQVPLLEIGREVIIESETIVRVIADVFPGNCNGLLPAAERAHVDRFIRLWVDTVEVRYYDLLRASNEQEAKFREAAFVGALVEVENVLWEPRYSWG